MENRFFLNSVVSHPLHFEIEPSEHSNLQFDSALSSMVSSPAESNENSVMRELIGKLGTVGNCSDHEISQNSCYATPLNSPPNPNNNIAPVMMNMNHLLKPISLNSNSVAQFSADPGFAERAAKFSCFGSRSFNETQLVMKNNAELLQRSGSPSLENFGSQLQDHDKLQVANNSQEESTISEQTPNGELGLKTCDTNSRKRKASSSKGKAKEASNYSNPSKGVEDTNAKRSKANEAMKMEGESKGGNNNAGEEKQNTKLPPEPPKDYIHVRARRGQATDSHSLAERVRREKISERMKLLQDLVPGCNKVTGKALMLDEIINYVQSLQRQVEFLSMKLASVNTRVDFSIESLISKDMFQSINSLANTTFPLDSSAQAFFGHQNLQNQANHNNIPNRTHVDPLDSSLCQNLGMHLPPLNGSNEGSSQFPPLTFCEDDLNTIVQMGFGQIANRKTPLQSQNFNGSNQESHMKIEL